MVKLTREQRLEKLDDEITRSLMDDDFQLENISIMVQEIEQELIALLPKKANPKITNWAYSAMIFGCGDVFYIEVNVRKITESVRPYICLRQIRMHDTLKNHGYATSILKILIQKSKAYGYDGVEIEKIQSPIMAHVAEKMGFAEIGRTTNYILITKD